MSDLEQKQQRNLFCPLQMRKGNGLMKEKRILWPKFFSSKPVQSQFEIDTELSSHTLWFTPHFGQFCESLN